MAHMVMLDDEVTGELTEVHWYCSDFCARHDVAYAGWYGCVELEVSQPCDYCGATIEGIYDMDRSN